MPTIVEELVTILGVSIAADALFKTTKFGKAVEEVNKYAMAAAASISAVEAAVVAFAVKANQSTSDLYRFGQLTGTNTDALQKMGYAADQAGGSAASLRHDISTLVKEMKPLLPGQMNQGLFMLFQPSGQNYTQFKDVFQLMTAISEKFKGMSAAESLQWGSQIGISEDTVMLLRKGKEGIEALQSESAKMGLIIPNQQLKQAFEFELQVKKVHSVVDRLGETIVAQLVPSLSKMVDKFTDWVQANRDWIALGLQKLVDGIAKGFGKFVDVLDTVRNALMKAFPHMKDFLSNLDYVEIISYVVLGVLTAMGAILAFLAVKWAAVAAAVGIVAFAFGEMVDYMNGADNAVGRFIDKVMAKFPSLTRMVKDVVKGFAELTPDLIDAFVKTLQIIWNFVSGIGEWVLKIMDRAASVMGYGSAEDKKNMADFKSGMAGNAIPMAQGHGTTITINSYGDGSVRRDLQGMFPGANYKVRDLAPMAQ